MNKFADDYFTSNIKDPEIQKDPRNWHKSLQTFSRYRTNTGLLNLINGPIAKLKQWQEALKGKREWEEVELSRDKKEIDEMNAT